MRRIKTQCKERKFTLNLVHGSSKHRIGEFTVGQAVVAFEKGSMDLKREIDSQIAVSLCIFLFN